MPPEPLPREPHPEAHADTPSIEAVLASQDWSDLARRLTRYAHVRLRGRSWETAEEIAQEAIARLLDPAYASWDRERHPDLFDGLGYIVNGLVSNYRQRKATRAHHVALRDDIDELDDDAPRDPRSDPDDDKHAPPPDAVVLRGEDSAEESRMDDRRDRRAEAAMAALRARLSRLADGALPLGLLDQIQQGEGRPLAQAKALGVSVADVYTAKRRLMHHARLVARDLEQDES
jgi:hypothetical protein